MRGETGHLPSFQQEPRKGSPPQGESSANDEFCTSRRGQASESEKAASPTKPHNLRQHVEVAAKVPLY